MPCNNRHRYGFKLQISRKIWHAAIVLLLGCDIATNPGPNFRPAGPHKPRANSILNDIAINTRSLKSLHSINGKQTSNLTRFQELVFTEDADLTLVTETWLNSNISNTEILANNYEICRIDRGSRAGGVLLAVKSNKSLSVHEIIDVRQCELELISVELTTNSETKLCACCCYRPRVTRTGIG